MPRLTSPVPKFRRRDKVVAVADLPGVPTGTEGVVYYEAGFHWFRYYVAFANGVEIGSVDGNLLVSKREWKKQQDEARRAEILAAREAKQAELMAAVRPAGAAHH